MGLHKNKSYVYWKEIKKTFFLKKQDFFLETEPDFYKREREKKTKYQN